MLTEGQQAARASIEEIVGAVDYLICNAAYKSREAIVRNLAEFTDDLDFLETEITKSYRVNVIGLINTITVFMPLVQRSSIKKIIALTSGMGSCDFVNQSGIDGGIPDSVSKAALNMLVAKYNVTYKSEGVFVMGICAGSVDTFEGVKPSCKSFYVAYVLLLQLISSSI
jgi:NAD(P)-dependent dehydrogenase (short-subunit alcohol dehydrogenase family)